MESDRAATTMAAVSATLSAIITSSSLFLLYARENWMSPAAGFIGRTESKWRQQSARKFNSFCQWNTTLTSSASFGAFGESDLLPGEALGVALAVVLAAPRRRPALRVGVRRLDVERRLPALVHGEAVQRLGVGGVAVAAAAAHGGAGGAAVPVTRRLVAPTRRVTPARVTCHFNSNESSWIDYLLLFIHISKIYIYIYIYIEINEY